MKLLMLATLFASFVGFGIYIYIGYKNRKVFFENLRAFCDHMLVEISFSRHTARHVIATYGGAYGKLFRALLDAYIALLDQKRDITRDRIAEIVRPRALLKLREPERAAITDLFWELGRHGPVEEAAKLTARRAAFDNLCQTATAALRREASIYLKIFILIGVTAVLLAL